MPILKQLFAVFTVRCRADAPNTTGHTRVRSACANWQSARASSLAKAYVKTNKYRGERETETRNERRAIFAKSQTTRARSQRWKIFYIANYYRRFSRIHSRRAFSIAPPARWVHFVHNSATGLGAKSASRAQGSRGERGEIEKLLRSARNFIFSRCTMGDNSEAYREAHRTITHTR